MGNRTRRQRGSWKTSKLLQGQADSLSLFDLKIKPALRLSFIISLFYFILFYFLRRRRWKATQDTTGRREIWQTLSAKKRRRPEQNDTNRTQPVWGVDFGCQPAKPSGRRRRKKRKKLQCAIIPSPVRFDIKTLSSFWKVYNDVVLGGRERDVGGVLFLKAPPPPPP